MLSTVTAIKKFWDKVDKSGKCWLWTGMRQWGGYGVLNRGGKPWMAHRYSWYLTHGRKPGSMCVLHKCDQRLCVRPDHLFLGTRAENNKDMIAKGRNARGVRAHTSKLDPDKVQHIRSALRDGVSQYKLAKIFEVAEATIYNIKAGKSWAWLPERTW